MLCKILCSLDLDSASRLCHCEMNYSDGQVFCVQSERKIRLVILSALCMRCMAISFLAFKLV